LELKIQNSTSKITEKAKNQSQLLRAAKEIMKLKRRYHSTARKISNMQIRKDRLDSKNNVANIEQIQSFSSNDQKILIEHIK